MLSRAIRLMNPFVELTLNCPRNSSKSIVPDPSLSKALKHSSMAALSRSKPNSPTAFLNSGLLMVLLPSSSMILNFLNLNITKILQY